MDVSTAFFTVPTVADFFRDDLPEHEQRRLQKRFGLLSQRQQGRKGTLLYDVQRSKHTCYFEEFLPGMMCATTEKLRVRGRTYSSLLEYYQQTYPHLPIKPDDPVARVSFPGLDRPQLVVAHRLRLRVMNDALPDALKQVDKIAPADRDSLIATFWALLGDATLGRGKPRVASHFWQPSSEQAARVHLPDLLFAEGQNISAPQSGGLKAYPDYYRSRFSLLREVGCLHVPPAVTRVIHFAVPQRVKDATARRLAQDITACLSQWSKKPMTPDVIMYDHLDTTLSRLQRETQPGVVVFVLPDEDPSDYFKVAYELKAWRVKRITAGELQARFTKLQRAESSNSVHEGKYPATAREWQSFIDMSALDVLQQLDCVPWGLASQLHYEAHLAIDVGADRRHFALSLLICRPQTRYPAFWLDTCVQVKSDTQRETINEIILRDALIGLFQRAKRQRFDPLQSVLVLRDGRESGREFEGIEAAQQELIAMGCLEREARVDVVDCHKYSVKGIRLWDRNDNGDVQHALEGWTLFPDDRTAVIVNTGAPTLHQGTAEPIMLMVRSRDIDMIAIATDVHAMTHLNWSSPVVAQRLPLTLKRTDDELANRAAQEIRRLR